MSIHPYIRNAIMVLIAVLALSASSYLSIPMEPVPVTLQTAVVLGAGVVLGSRRGMVSVLIWLTLALAGLPVLADGKAGLEALAGKTAGFLWSFPFTCWLAGYLPRGFSIKPVGIAFVGAMCLHVLILSAGYIWLAQAIGYDKAWTYGVWPFLPGGVLKSVMVAMLAGLVGKFRA